MVSVKYFMHIHDGNSSTISETHIEIRRDNPRNDFYLPLEKNGDLSRDECSDNVLILLFFEIYNKRGL